MVVWTDEMLHARPRRAPLSSVELMRQAVREMMRRLRRWFATGMFVAIGMALALSVANGAKAPANHSKLDRGFQQSQAGAAPEKLLQVIVQTASPLSKAMEDCFQRMGGRITARFSVVQGFSGSIPASSLRLLAAEPWVAHVSRDTGVKKLEGWQDSVGWRDSTLWADCVEWPKTVTWSDSVDWSDSVALSDSFAGSEPVSGSDSPAWASWSYGTHNGVSVEEVWGDVSIWGDSSDAQDTPAWGEGAVWADVSVWADSDLPDSSVWADSAVWEDSTT